MKTRHLVIGFTMVLVLSWAVPALGGPLGIRSSGMGKMKLQVKKALKIASAAQGTANAAQGTANGAQGTANAAQSAANSAQTAAAAAKGAANGAQSTAELSKTAADEARSVATAAQATANTALSNAGSAEGAARNAGDRAQEALVRIGERGITGVRYVDEMGFDDGQGHLIAEAICPHGSIISGGGFTSSGGATPRVSEPEGNGWVAVSTGGGFLKAWAICLLH